MSVAVWIGTRKGAFVARSKDRKTWKIEGPLLRGQEVNHIVVDPRDPKRAYAAALSGWFGPHLHMSVDGGKTWNLSEKGLELPRSARSVHQTLLARPAGPRRRARRVWAGADPGALFRSGDWGQSWEQVSSLMLHPTRSKWNPGGGGMCLHSIQCLGKGRIVVAISAAGTFRSLDGGATWEPFNQGDFRRFEARGFPDYEATRSPRLAFTASRYSESLSGSRAPFSIWRCTAF